MNNQKYVDKQMKRLEVTCRCGECDSKREDVEVTTVIFVIMVIVIVAMLRA